MGTKRYHNRLFKYNIENRVAKVFHNTKQKGTLFKNKGGQHRWLLQPIKMDQNLEK